MYEGVLSVLQNYWDTILFYLPLGIIGLWRWSVWLFKKNVSLFYSPKKNNFYASVSIITPVYNEDPVIFKRALESWRRNSPHEIIAVIDYTDKKCINIFENFAKTYLGARLVVTYEPGKREALAKGISSSRSEVCALVDSDTIWDEKVIKNALPPFEDPNVAGVATRQNVLNPKTATQKLFDIQLDLRYVDDFAFMSAAGDALICLSGRTAFYRKEILMPLLPDLLNETFWGKKVVSGDDKRLTYLVLEKGYKVYYQENARVYTPGMEKMSKYLKQRLRWTRNALRADLRAMWQGWVFKRRALAFFQIDKVIQTFAVLISPIYFFAALLTGELGLALLIFSWWFGSRFIKILPHLRRYPTHVTILPLFIVYTFGSAVLKLYSFFTLNEQGWITRWDMSRLPKLNFLRKIPAYAESIVVIVLLVAGVLLYRNQIYSQFNTKVEEAFAMTPNLRPSLPQVLGASEGGDRMLLTRYQVENAESLGEIANKFGVLEQDLLLANASTITNIVRVEPGMVLNIPRPDFKLASPTTNYSSLRTDLPPLNISYDSLSDTVNIEGRGRVVRLSAIRDSVGDQHLKEISPKEWLLSSNLNIKSGVILSLDSSEVEKLRLLSTKDKFIAIRGSSAIITMNRVRVTSWDDEVKDVDKNYNDKRSYILVKDGSRMDIYDSELSYLGYPRPETEDSTYGVSWRMSAGKLGSMVLTGEVINSKFHNNYFGAYTFGATSMLFRGNEFYDNAKYGLDPHDDSNFFLVEQNKFYRNGNHGLIFSKRCINNRIINNESYENGLHGIMLHEFSNNNIVEDNTSYGNTDGIAIYGSSNNQIKNNALFLNKTGVRANAASKDNVIEGNSVYDNYNFGIYLYDSSDNNYVAGNVLKNNRNGLYIKTNDNQLVENEIKDNKVGVFLFGKAANNKVMNNKISGSRDFGIYAKTRKKSINLLGNNSLFNNRFDIATR